jgi:hypothetical protein
VFGAHRWRFLARLEDFEKFLSRLALKRIKGCGNSVEKEETEGLSSFERLLRPFYRARGPSFVSSICLERCMRGDHYLRFTDCRLQVLRSALGFTTGVPSTLGRP